MNLLIPRKTRAAKELSSGPMLCKLIALFPFRRLSNPPSLLPRLPYPAKEGRIPLTQCKLIALLPFRHLLRLPPFIHHLPRSAKEERTRPRPSKLLALLPFSHLLSLLSLLPPPFHPAKEMRLDPMPSQLIARLRVPSNRPSNLPPLIPRPPRPAKERLYQLIALFLSSHVLNLPFLLQLWINRAPPYHHRYLPQLRHWRKRRPIECIHQGLRFHMSPRHSSENLFLTPL